MAVGIGLYRPKTPINVGHVMRAAGCYGVDFVALTSPPRYKGARTDVHKSWRRIPVVEFRDLHEAIPLDWKPVAIEIRPGATSLVDYVHPKRAFYVFGPEDGSVPKEILRWCADVVFIPTISCLNLAMAVNVVLYDRIAKEQKP